MEDSGGAQEDPTTCTVCRKREPEHNMLLCDGCDAPYHTDCLKPALPGIPTGSWLCPGCEAQVEGAGMSGQQATRWAGHGCCMAGRCWARQGGRAAWSGAAWGGAWLLRGCMEGIAWSGADGTRLPSRRRCLLAMMEQRRGREMLQGSGALARLAPALAASSARLAGSAAAALPAAVAGGGASAACVAAAAQECFEAALAHAKAGGWAGRFALRWQKWQCQPAASWRSRKAGRALTCRSGRCLPRPQALMHRALHAQQQQLVAGAAKGAGAAEEEAAAAEAADEARLQLQLGFQELLQSCATLAAAADKAVVSAGAAAAAASGGEQGPGSALGATLAGLGQVLGLAADAAQLQLLYLDDGCPAAVALAGLVSEALAAAGRLAPVAAGSGVEEALGGGHGELGSLAACLPAWLPPPPPGAPTPPAPPSSPRRPAAQGRLAREAAGAVGRAAAAAQRRRAAAGAGQRRGGAAGGRAVQGLRRLVGATAQAWHGPAGGCAGAGAQGACLPGLGKHCSPRRACTSLLRRGSRSRARCRAGRAQVQRQPWLAPLADAAGEAVADQLRAHRGFKAFEKARKAAAAAAGGAAATAAAAAAAEERENLDPNQGAAGKAPGAAAGPQAVSGPAPHHTACCAVQSLCARCAQRGLTAPRLATPCRPARSGWPRRWRGGWRTRLPSWCWRSAAYAPRR